MHDVTVSAAVTSFEFLVSEIFNGNTPPKTYTCQNLSQGKKNLSQGKKNLSQGIDLECLADACDNDRKNFSV
jgi:hypothetical protein